MHRATSTPQLCSSLGTSLNRFEMETALFVLDKDGSGLITEGEFVDWYRGSAVLIPTN
jgi:Ca2+-binding EF-hand superfamily protein